MEEYLAVGRRKTSVARIRLKAGKGAVTVNDEDHTKYFSTAILHYKINQPFTVTNTAGQFDVKATVNGGGYNGQAEAVRLGITRALIKYNPELKPLLKADELTTRDPRMVERKKPGQKKARKRFQFSKR
ncbi:MAG TPA: 30S ribosomal protein S9 [Flavobacteriales bacterium]|nr:30S ribosomal protein S9 [Flavobacteriales bacterium]